MFTSSRALGVEPRVAADPLICCRFPNSFIPNK